MDPRNRLLLRVAAKVWPGAFLLGAGMELFMIQTGFYRVVTRKEAERRAERDAKVREYKERKRERRRARESGEASGEGESAE